MCLAVPGKVTEIYDTNGLKMGKIDYGGTVQEACLEYCPEVQVGEYAIVHAGFAISILDEEEAQKSLEAWKELEEAEKEMYGDTLNNPDQDTGFKH
ncbi:MAG: HypC/HybG/HupF family hydrogenase formation chaperone [Candidatus Marinimicrobia bacterium]|nr:HypC/HybG/HupF family hydrogenase formation chaperone [Candidatus Neomarinimicrobiota bacterium]MCF7828465.1 HypC/HybG/HupF family hydrogenase formation chaperone [Candidatus Neomarinimicrobiota bacterium]MCF7880941.1 HypC/HybG/HupF family hydrogenase formation chaperone [Candidatus Neomarinimicrobiota bacterium]